MQGNQAPDGPLGMSAGFFSSLFDMDFKTLITVRVIKILYWLIIMLASLSALLTFLRVLFTGRPVAIILAVILTPLFYLLEIMFARVGLELVLVIFRMADDVRAIKQGGTAPTVAGYPPSGAGGATPQYPQYPPQYPQYPEATQPPEDPPNSGYSYPGGGDPDPSATGDDDHPWIT
jgi:hypothetical protein